MKPRAYKQKLSIQERVDRIAKSEQSKRKQGKTGTAKEKPTAGQQWSEISGKLSEEHQAQVQSFKSKYPSNAVRLLL